MSRLYQILRGLGHHLANAVKALIAWQVRSRLRTELLALNDHALKDIGLTRTDVLSENGPLFRQDTDSDDRRTR